MRLTKAGAIAGHKAFIIHRNAEVASLSIGDHLSRVARRTQILPNKFVLSDLVRAGYFDHTIYRLTKGYVCHRSRDFLRRSVYEGNMNPTRTSIWDDEQFRAHTSGWGAFYDVGRTLVERDASVLVTPAGSYLQIATRWVRALLDAYSGRADVAEALEAAAADIDELVVTAPM